MKRFFCLLSLLLSLLLFSSCLSSPSDQASTDTDKALAYEAVISQLQSELASLQAKGAEQATAYEAKIAALEAEILALRASISTGGSPSAGTSPFRYVEADGGILILSYSGLEKNLTIPATIDGKRVVGIAEKAFYNSPLESIVLPDGIKSIGWFAFAGSYRLQRVVMPSSISSIAYGAFDLCSSSLKVVCSTGSYAQLWAKSYGIATVES